MAADVGLVVIIIQINVFLISLADVLFSV